MREIIFYSASLGVSCLVELKSTETANSNGELIGYKIMSVNPQDGFNFTSFTDGDLFSEEQLIIDAIVAEVPDAVILNQDGDLLSIPVPAEPNITWSPVDGTTGIPVDNMYFTLTFDGIVRKASNGFAINENDIPNMFILTETDENGTPISLAGSPSVVSGNTVIYLYSNYNLSPSQIHYLGLLADVIIDVNDDLLPSEGINFTTA